MQLFQLKPKLVIVSIDGVLRSNFFSEYAWPFMASGVAINKFKQDGAQIVLIANAGGVGCRVALESMTPDERWTDPSNYPSRVDAEREIEALSVTHFGEALPYSLAFKYHREKKDGSVVGEQYVPKDLRFLPEWSDDWRLPAPGMINHWLDVFETYPSDAVLIGSGINDLKAAQRADVRFIHIMSLFDELLGAVNF